MKTVKAFLKICLEISNTDRDSLKGIEKLNDEEFLVLGRIRASVQNELGENSGMLSKFDIDY